MQKLSAAPAAVVVCLLVVGCSQDPVAGPPGPQGERGEKGESGLRGEKGESGAPGGLYASGSRLKARLGVTPDGARMFLGWFDSARGEACGFHKMTDGKIRCFPDGVTIIAEASRFADSACSRPIARKPSDFQEGSYAGAQLMDGAQIYTVIGEHQGPVYLRWDTCVEDPSVTATMLDLVEIPPAEFQEMTEQLDD